MSTTDYAPIYEVVVGGYPNPVYRGDNPVNAESLYYLYVLISQTDETSPALGKDVVLFEQGYPALEFFGWDSKEQAFEGHRSAE